MYIVGSLLWVGPMIFQRFKIQSAYFIVFLLGFSILDIVNVYVINPGVPSSEHKITASVPTMLVSGYVRFGSFMIGMGDFVLSFVAVSWIKRYKGISAALFAAVLIAVPLVFIRLIDPVNDIPYAPFVTIPAVSVFFLF
jgi:hypothetical protein